MWGGLSVAQCRWLGMFVVLCLAGCVAGTTVTPSPEAKATPTVAFTPAPTPAHTPTTVPPTATVQPSATPTTAPVPTSTAIRVGQHPYSMTLQVQETAGITQTVQVNYLLYLPAGYGQDDRKWPLILFLHGQLEWGDDPAILVRQGVPKLLDEGEKLPALVVSPQTPEGKRWWPRTAILGAFLDRMEATFAVDSQRVYLTGISMGAYGAWALAMHYPQRFAALVPIAGGADFNSEDVPEEICELKDVPTWAFHGEMDLNVPYTESVNAVEALQACDGDVRLTLYPGAAHVEAWERAYADPDLWMWLFAQQRQP